MDDNALIAAVAAGDDGALRRLYVANAPWLAGRLRRHLPADVVEDVLQETFTAVWRGAARYRLPRRGRRRDRRRSAAGLTWRFGRAIVNDPGLLLDEPTAGLDPEQRVGERGDQRHHRARPRPGARRTAEPGRRRARHGRAVPGPAGRRRRRPVLHPHEPGRPCGAARLAALSPAARHTWLATHITAIRAGKPDLP